MEDGIYFNLPEAEYHAIDRLSASGIQKIRVSLPDYWAASPMNPYREEVDNNTEARITGRAYHCAFLEPDQFDKRYCFEPSKEDHPDALRNDTAVKKELQATGQAMSKPGENAAERARRLVASGFDGEIFQLIHDEWFAGLNGRTPLKKTIFDQINRDHKQLYDNPEISRLITGGAAEVSILYTCPDSGILMKLRVDYLKAIPFLDLKSFDNPEGRPVNEKLFAQFRYNRYYIQARSYQKGIATIGPDTPIHGEATPEQISLIKAIALRAGPPECWYLFRQKKGVPNLLARQVLLDEPPAGWSIQAPESEICPPHLLRPTGLALKADAEIAHAKKLYANALDVWGRDQPWTGFDQIGSITDEDFSPYWIEA